MVRHNYAQIISMCSLIDPVHVTSHLSEISPASSSIVDTTGDSKSGLDPHVYEVSALSYRGLSIDGRQQSILVSGESGAGKAFS